jgi:hypothetical protein
MNTNQIHMRLPQQAADHLEALVKATGRRRSDLIIQAIMDLRPTGALIPGRSATPTAARSAARSPHFLSRAPDMVVIDVQKYADTPRPKLMMFSRPSRQADQWVWCILWRRGRDIPGYDIETRPMPDVLADMDIWEALERGEAVPFDKAIPEHRKLIGWPAWKLGPQPMSEEEYERDAAKQAERFDAYVRGLPTREVDSVEAEPIGALED